MGDENRYLNHSSSVMKTPSLTSPPSSGSPTRDTLTRTHYRTASPSNLDNSQISNGTPPLTPSPVIRRALTYSPTKRGTTWSHRITIVLLGLIMVSVLLTMLFSLLLMDDSHDPDRGLTFGSPIKFEKKGEVVHSRIRGGHEVSELNLTKHDEGEMPVVPEEQVDAANDNVIPKVNTGNDKDVAMDGIYDKSGGEVNDAEPAVIEVNLANETLKDDQLFIINGEALKDPQINGNGLEDNLEEMPDNRS